MKPAISIRAISKQYEIYSEGKRLHTFRDDLMDTIKRLLGREHDQNYKEKIWALRDVSFDVFPGEAVGIMGYNGSGKSTLLKILAKVTQPTLGQAVLLGRVGAILEVGAGFHSELTGRENIFINGAVLGMKQKEIRDKFDEIVDFSGVEKFLDTPVKQYSSGMQVRLAFSIAAHIDPDILLIDEALAVGDVVFQEKCLAKMRERLTLGTTVLFVSHSLQSLKSLCNRGLVLKGGGLVCDAPIEESVANYSCLSRV